jgi:hypothetical protein
MGLKLDSPHPNPLPALAGRGSLRRCRDAPCQILRIAVLLLFLLLPCRGQKSELHSAPPFDLAKARKEGSALAAELLAQLPEGNATNSGAFEIRAAGRRRTIPLRFEVLATPTNWLSIYETTASSNGPGGIKLTVIHAEGRPNEYLLAGPDASNTGPRRLAGNETMIPFAGSDFWIGDLGLEFLHWPEQRLLKKEPRRTQSCEVLESINPQPAPGAYSRVDAWLEIEPPHGIVHADAYDDRNQLLKEFDPKKLEKRGGQWQPEKLEIRNRQTGSRTAIVYDLRSPES